MCTSRVSAHAFKAAYVAPLSRGDHFQFGSVFIKKSNQTEFFFLKKKPNRTETGRFDLVSVFLGQKSVQTGLDRFFWFGSVFFRFLSVSFRFGLVFSVFCL
jgi:hypothetical protein